MISSKKNNKINLKKNSSKNNNFFSPFINAIKNNKPTTSNSKINQKKNKNNVNNLNTSQNKQKKINNNQDEINKKQTLKTNNNCNFKNNNIFKESTTVLPTNCSEEEGKKVITKKNTEEKNPLYLNKIYKQTIIIDEDGNNNLNINKHDKLISDNIFIKNRNKANQENNKFDDISQDTERLKEYGKIFNMLNNNIEDMKQLFQDNDNCNNNKNNNIGGKNKHENKNNFIQIFSKKDIEEIEKIQPSPKKKEILNEKDEESFLGSCIRDTFFESLKNKDNCSINEYSSIFSNSNINFDINNLDQTIVEDDENYRTYNFKHNLVINPHFLLTNYKKMNNKKKIKNNNNNGKYFYTKNKNIKKIKNKEEKGCIIF